MKIYETFEDEYKYYIVIEAMLGDSLLTYISKTPQTKFTEKFVAGIMKQVLQGLGNCHSYGIAHRDIKPDNIMFADKENTKAKLIDFGFAKMFDPGDRRVQEVLGSPMYMAPEVCNRKPYDTKCDIWSCGILCFILLSGELPYNVDENAPLAMLLGLVKSVDFNLDNMKSDAWKRVSLEAKNFALSMLTKDPDKRPTAAQLLTSPWLDQANDIQANVEDTKNCLDKLLKSHVINPHFILLGVY